MPNDLINVTLRWLEHDALDALEPLMRERGWMSLNKPTSRALCAYDERDKMIGFVILQMVPHTEPLYVEREWRGSGLAEELSEEMHNFLTSVGTRGFMLVADNSIAAQIAEKHGMHKVESPVYIKIDNGEGV